MRIPKKLFLLPLLYVIHIIIRWLLGYIIESDRDINTVIQIHKHTPTGMHSNIMSAFTLAYE